MLAVSQQSIEFDEGYNACLYGIKYANCPYFPHSSEQGQAWQQGWKEAERQLKGKRKLNGS